MHARGPGNTASRRPDRAQTLKSNGPFYCTRTLAGIGRFHSVSSTTANPRLRGRAPGQTLSNCESQARLPWKGRGRQEVRHTDRLVGHLDALPPGQHELLPLSVLPARQNLQLPELHSLETSSVASLCLDPETALLHIVAQTKLQRKYGNRAHFRRPFERFQGRCLVRSE